MKHLLSILIGIAFAGFLMVLGITQEVPRGQISGRVTMAENGRGLPKARVVLTPLGDPTDPVNQSRVLRTLPDGSYAGRSIPAGQYHIEVSARAHTLKRKIISIEEGQVAKLDLALKPNEPYLRLYQSQRVWTPNQKPQVELHGFLPDDSVRVKCFRLNYGKLAQSGNVDSLLYSLARADGNASTQQIPTDSAPLLDRLQTLKSKDAEGVAIEPLDLKPLPPGLYWVKANTNSLKGFAYLNITKIGLVTKSSPHSTLCYVTDLESGQPVSGAIIQSVQQKRLRTVGKTDKDGLFTAKDSGVSFVAVDKDSVAISGGMDNQSDSNEYHFFTYTDRPVYRPGDTIHFKSIIRQLTKGDFAPPPQGNATVEFRDGDDNLLERTSVNLNGHGSVAGEFTPNKEVNPGYFKIVVKYNGATDRHSVNLSAYRKPEYEVKVESEKPTYFTGDRASVIVRCTYYYGGPVVGAKVKGNVYRTPAWDNSDSDSEDDPEDRSSDVQPGGFVGGDFSAEVNGVTDARGEVHLEFDTRSPKDPQDLAIDFNYSVSLAVAAPSGKSVDSSGTVRVLQGDIGLTATTDRNWYGKSDPIRLSLRANHVGDHLTPAPGQSLAVSVGTETWTKNVSKFSEVNAYTLVTDSAGKAQLTVPSKPGNFVIRVSGQDSHGRTVRSDTYLYVDGGSMHSPKDAKFSLMLDKSRHEIGESVNVRLATEDPGGCALLTVEADRVITHQLVRMNRASVSVDLPVISAYAPNVYVSAVYIRSKSYSEVSKNLTVNRVDRKLTVKVETDRASFTPGSRVNVNVQTLDNKGHGVPADVSLGVVDESIYAIQPDNINIFRSLYPRRYNRVRTSYSFPEIYLDGGDKGGGAIPLRRKFLDTAFWIPNVQTDANGIGRIGFKLPDNITTWRVTAIGCTDSTMAGQTTEKFKARKDLMVRYDLPTFTVKGDVQQIVVAITNDTDRAADVKLLASIEGGKFDGDVPKSVHIEAHTLYALPLEMTATESGAIRLTARAWIPGGPSDGVEQTVACAPHGLDQTQIENGTLRGLATTLMTRSTSADPKMGGLTITLTPSAASTLIPSLQNLIDFPYGCVEQTMNRFLPSVLVSQTMKKMGQASPKLEALVPKIVADGYARLGKMQHADGGFGWWEFDESDPFMTALVLEGLDEARRAGYPIRFVKLGAAVKWSAARLVSPKGEKDSLSDRMYMAYSLAKLGDHKTANLIAQKIPISDPRFIAKADPAELSLAARLYQELNLTAKRDICLRAIQTTAILDGPFAHWRESAHSWGEENTAFALAALQHGEPSNPQIEMAVRYLLLKRGENGWTSTRATSFVLRALCAYVEHAPDRPENAKVEVWVNGQLNKTFAIAKGIESALMQVRIPMTALSSGDNRVELRTTGKSSLTYSMQLQQSVGADTLAASPDRGLRIERTYHRLESQAMEDGTLRLLPSKSAVTQAKSGDLIQCVLVINSDRDREFMQIEDRIPSNVRITDREDPGENEPWENWWSRAVFLDDRAAFFSRRIPKGKSVIRYMMRAEGAGSSCALPATVVNMYDSAQSANSTESTLTVEK